jgi:hypothetical protein
MKREPLTDLEDLRDDCVAVVLNSGHSFKRVHERGGPTPQTISKWLYRETMFPQLATVRAMLKACDHELTIAPKGSDRIKRINPEGAEHVSMPPKETSTSGTTPRISRLLRAQRPAAMIKGAGARAAARKAARRSK